jgi:Zn-dependent protease with chaperone function
MLFSRAGGAYARPHILVLVSEKRPSSPIQTTVDERGRFRVHPEWVGQATLINVGLIVLGIYLVATLIGTGTPDIASKIAIISLVVSLPLLAILSMLLQLQESRRFASNPWYLILAQVIAQGAAVLGFGATLWHVWFPASIALAVSGLAGLFIYQAYYRRLRRDNEPERSTRRGKAS